jgi:TPR repeat protein
MKRIIFLLFIVHLGFPHLVLSTVDNLFAENIKKIRSRAKAGDSEAQFMLGKLYYYGFSVELSYKEATKWLRAAAIQGHPSSQFLLGEAYENGKGLQKDYMQPAADIDDDIRHFPHPLSITVQPLYPKYCCDH